MIFKINLQNEENRKKYYKLRFSFEFNNKKIPYAKHDATFRD